jgi:glycosyltransferase 2 family protein
MTINITSLPHMSEHQPDRSAPERGQPPTAGTPPQIDTGAPVASRSRLLWRLGISLAIAGFFVWLMRAGAMPLLPSRELLSQVRWWTPIAYVLGWSVVHLVRAARWQLLLAPIAEVSLRRVLSASFIGFLAILVLPLRAGEVVRPMLIRQQGRLSAWAAAGTLGAERIVDGFMLSAILFIALQLATPLDPLPERLGDLPIPVAIIPSAAYAALLVFSCALLVMLAFYKWKVATRRVLQWGLGGISPRLSDWVASRIEHLAAGLSFLSRWRQSVPFLLMTLVYWLLNAACTWLLAWGVGFAEFDAAQACVVMGVLALGVLMPNAPGFFGAFQFSLYAGLAVFYPREQVLAEGSAFVFLMYLAQALVTLVFAGWAVLWGKSAERRVLGWRAGVTSICVP